MKTKSNTTNKKTPKRQGKSLLVLFDLIFIINALYLTTEGCFYSLETKCPNPEFSGLPRISALKSHLLTVKIETN